MVLLTEVVPLQKHISLVQVDNQLPHMLARYRDPICHLRFALQQPSHQHQIKKNGHDQPSTIYLCETWVLKSKL